MNEIQPAAGLTPNELFEKFLRLSVADGTASIRTIRSYREGLACFLAWCAGDPGPFEIPIDPIKATYDDIEVYRRWLVERGYKRSTIRLRLTAVRVLYTALTRWGRRPDNPAAGIKAPRPSDTAAGAVLRKALSPDETRQLLARIQICQTPLQVRNRAIITLLIFHGLRAAELAGLTVLDLDRASYTKLEILGKGAKRRTIILSAEARAALLAWNKWGGAVLMLDESAPLFYALDSDLRHRLSVRAIERIVDKELKGAGLKQPGRSAHSLRHTSAVLAILGGADREALADALGHTSTRTTEIYIRAAGSLQHNPSGAVSAALREQGNSPPYGEVVDAEVPNAAFPDKCPTCPT